MSPVLKAQPFPNLFLARPDGTTLELSDLRRKEHALVLLLSKPAPEALAFLDHFQAQAKLFRWLQTRLLPVFPRLEVVPTPWPAPDYPPCLFNTDLPEGLQWDRAYVVSRNGTLLEIYPELDLLSVDKVEKDLLYWEANHCLP